MPEQPRDELEPAAPKAASVRGAAWLVPEILVVVFDRRQDDAEAQAVLETNGSSHSLPLRQLDIPAGPEGSGGSVGLLFVHVPEPLRPALARSRLVLETGESELSLSGRQVGEAARSLRELARRHLAPLPGPARNEISHFAAIAAPGLAGAAAEKLQEALHDLRAALREHLRPADESARMGLGVEKLLSIDAFAFYAYGWMGDRDAKVTRMTAVTPEGERVDLSERLFRYRRPDVSALFPGERGEAAGTGFACYFELNSPSHLSRGWMFEIENDRGDAVEVEAPEAICGRPAVTVEILEDPYHQHRQDDELMATHVVPAVTRLQAQVQALGQVDSSTDFGSVPRSPEVSIVVPLHGRIDLIEYQLAKFADDPELRSAELIYVLDSPDQGEQLLALAGGISEIYRVPFRIHVLAESVGFAGACNAGAAAASGRLVLLLNSDVLPSRPGWLGSLAAFYDETPRIGALGPKLLYEDDTIQAAGMYLHKAPEETVWRDAHYFKCLHKSFPAANVARPVPAISGACMMVVRELYEQLGGMRGAYVRGDYEDFDLCLRLAELGLENWYLPHVELYHLEALSYESSARLGANRYNAWLHTHLWRSRIETLMSGHESPDGAPALNVAAGE